MADSTYKLAIQISALMENSVPDAARKTNSELEKMAQKANRTSKEIETTFAGISTKGIDNLARISDKTFSGIVKGAKVAGAAVTAALGVAVYTGADYEEQMSAVQSITNASSTDMEKLNQLAKEMGAVTKFSASESGEAMEYMAMAGWKTEDMLDGLKGIMDLAAATGEDLATTSDIVTDALTAYGLQAKDSGMFTDVLAQAASNSNTNVSMMGETFKYVAPVAGAFGYTVQDSALAIGLMANSGIKAERAGTALRTIMTNLSGEVELAGKNIGKLTINTVNADGSMKPWKETMDELRGAFSQMSESERAANAEAIAGKEAMTGLLAIVNASEADYQKLSQAIDNSAGATDRMSKIRLDNLKGDVEILQGGLETLGLTAYEGLSAPLREIVQEFSAMVDDFAESDLMNGFVKSIPTVRRKIKGFGKAVKEELDPLISVGEWFIENPAVLEGSLKGIGAALVTFKGIQAAKNVRNVISGIGTAVTAWPVAAVGVVIGGIVGITSAIKANEERLKNENLSEHFGDIALSVEELQDVSQRIVSTKALLQLDEALGQMENVESIKNDLSDTVENLDFYNWKVSMGLDLNSDELEGYQSEIQSYIENSLEGMTQTRYGMSLNIAAMTGEDAMGQQIRQELDSFYSNQYDQLQEYGGQLGQVVADAFQDEMLNIDEIAAITELQNKMGDIMQQISASEFDAKLQLMETNYGGELDAESFQNLQAELNDTVAEAQGKLEESYTYNLAAEKARLNTGDISQEEYDKQVDYITGQYLSQKGEIQAKAVSFQTETILKQYEEEIGEAMPEFQQLSQQYMEDALWALDFGSPAAQVWDSYFQNIDQAAKEAGIDKTTRSALTELFEPLTDSITELTELQKQIQNVGGEVPEAVSEALESSASLGSITGDYDAIMYQGAEYIKDSPGAQQIIDNARQQGSYIPEAFADGFYNPESLGKLDTAIDKTLDYMNRKMIYKGLGTRVLKAEDYLIRPESHADGGLMTRPTLSWFAERSPEMAIPIDGSQNAIALWQETGRLLGAYEENSYSRMYQSMMETEKPSAPVFQYSPTLYFQGGNQEEHRETLRTSYDEFKEMMERFETERRRSGF